MDRITAAHVFVTIADRGSMIAAADALEMSRAMVSRYLAQMEDWAGVRLIQRTTRKLSLTDAGEAALQRSRALLELAGQMRETAQDAGPRGLLRVSCAQSLGEATIAAAVCAFLARHPQVRVDLQVSSHAVHLVEERIDLAIRITNELDPNLVTRPLAGCDSVLCAAPAYLAAHGTPAHVDELARHHCLGYAYFGKSLWQFSRGDERFAVPVSSRFSANESNVLRAAAIAGAGISMQPRYAVAPQLASGKLVAVLQGFEPRRLGIHAVFASRRQMSPALRALLDFLIDWFANDPQWQSDSRAR
ncbi:LysR family transcriptional regulator [Jeongeupia naejangsanensis]|uniref:LysR family transcriptional regulator n=1 Tax=Jeongeupia naejangsanensis TaxID=613195 RepID=A0ABS2BKM6_9NEIS|nr:LysR family transcriptional regulator [Jeongeupia naejangsanensis]MBM3116146.1 LysR family transcriptional regulator [Jeongeupia naejangsanensis]